MVELMVSTALIAVIALLLVTMTNSTAATWRYTTGRIEQFRGADTAFEAMTRRLSQATLNTYWDYEYPNNDRAKPPSKYVRQSDLRFITGSMTNPNVSVQKRLLTTTAPRRPTQGVFFQAPLGYVDDATNFSGLDNLLNTWGYYVEFRDETLARPAFVTQPARYRYRLMELMQPSNSLSIYNYTSGKAATYTAKDWFTAALPTSAVAPIAGATPLLVHALADNVIALVVLPRLSKKDETSTGKTLSKDYSYDSTSTNTDADINPKSQLPPIVQVTLVAIDENSAARMANGVTPPALDATLDAIFLDSTKFDADLVTLQKSLTDQRISYRVFTSNVSIRGAKWSRK